MTLRVCNTAVITNSKLSRKMMKLVMKHAPALSSRLSACVPSYCMSVTGNWGRVRGQKSGSNSRFGCSKHVCSNVVAAKKEEEDNVNIVCKAPLRVGAWGCKHQGETRPWFPKERKSDIKVVSLQYKFNNSSHCHRVFEN